MRMVLIGMLLLASGCSTVRSALGEYQKAADKGIGINTSAQAEAEAAATPAGGKAGEAARRDLPATLGGDHANHVYTTPPSR